MAHRVRKAKNSCSLPGFGKEGDGGESGVDRSFPR